MPARQVYGKRTITKPTITAYAQLISPTHDDVAHAKTRLKAKGKQERANKIPVDGLVNEFERLGVGEIAIAGHDDGRSDPWEGATHTATPPNFSKQGSRSLEEPRSLDKVHDEEQAGKENLVKNPTRNSSTARTAKRSAKSALDVHLRGITTHNSANTRDKTTQRSAQARTLTAVVVPRRLSPTPTPELFAPDTTPEPEDLWESYLSALLCLSDGRKIRAFEEWSQQLEPHFKVSKIAEASFSEVYRLKARSATTAPGQESVLKVVAIKASSDAPLPCGEDLSSSKQANKEHKAREKRDQWKSRVDDIESEVKLLKNLNIIPGFTNFRELTVLQGRPSQLFVNAWKAWNKPRSKGMKSEFPDPSRKTSYDATQLWAVIEMEDAGTDCEKVMQDGCVSTIWEIWDVFWGVCLSVAKAEETSRFEHRDLHMENICIQGFRSDRPGRDVQPFIENPLGKKLGFTRLATTVIDYTLSRAEIPRQSTSITRSTTTNLEDHEVAYLDLNKDMGLFNGDASQEYQYEIYRYMQGIVLHNDPLKQSSSSQQAEERDRIATITSLDPPRRSPRKTPQHIRFPSASPGRAPSPAPRRTSGPPIRKSLTGELLPLTSNGTTDPWRAYHPKTNLVWAHFILSKLLTQTADHSLDPLYLSAEEIMQHVDASQDLAPKIHKQACKLSKVLRKVAHLLEMEQLRGDGGLGSMTELVVLALERGWLGVDDVVGD